jgi:hypothetical protein
MSMVGPPLNRFDLTIFNAVSNALSERDGSVGSRKDFLEPPEFAGKGNAQARQSMDKSDNTDAFLTASSSVAAGLSSPASGSAKPTWRWS